MRKEHFDFTEKPGEIYQYIWAGYDKSEKSDVKGQEPHFQALSQGNPGPE